MKNISHFNTKAIELIEMVERQLKEIDDCPLIAKKVSWIDRFFFGETESQADILKKEVIARGKITALSFMEYYRELSNKT